MEQNCKQVVIIDDSRTTLLLLENILYEFDLYVEVHSFDKAVKGFHYLQSHTPDLVMLDLLMPKLSGLEILKEIKKSLMVPVFVVSAETKMNVIEEAFTLGADEYFKKPLDIKLLREKLQHALFAKNIHY
ncbi:MAG: response regulator [Bacteroidota bacterium]